TTAATHSSAACAIQRSISSSPLLGAVIDVRRDQRGGKMNPTRGNLGIGNVALAIVVLAISACGDGDGNGGGGGAGSTATPTPTATRPANTQTVVATATST